MSTTRIQGIVFPIQLSGGKHQISGDMDLIQSSIKIILTWPLGTREYEDSFGSRLNEALEDQNDDILLTLVKKFVIDSISKWEQRLELIKFTFKRPHSSSLKIDIQYRIKDIHIEDTISYTFYTN